MLNFYNVLGVSTSATSKEISKAYRNLAKIHHPDAGGNAEEMVLINKAYEILSDDEKRKEYDSFYSSSNSTSNEDKQSQKSNETNSKSFYWQTTSFNLNKETKYSEEIWKLFLEKIDNIPYFGVEIENYFKVGSKKFSGILKKFFQVPQKELLIFEEEVFPSFIKAGFILSSILRDKLPNNQIYWDKYKKIFVSVFKRNPYEYLIEENHETVEDIFSDEFNIIGKKFLDSFIYEFQNINPNININNTSLVTMLATLFIYGYHIENSTEELLEIKYSSPSMYYMESLFGFYYRNKKLSKVIIFIIVVSFLTYLNTR